jgi:hypothetical protein
MKLVIAFALALAACGGSPPPAPAAPAAAPPPAPPPMTGIALAELKFYVGDIPRLALHADGRLEQNMRATKSAKDSWVVVATVTADGKLAHDGQPIGELRPDGTFVTADGKVQPFKLDGDALIVGERRLTVDEAGNLQGGDPKAEKLRIEGASDAGARRSALLLLAIITGAV